MIKVLILNKVQVTKSLEDVVVKGYCTKFRIESLKDVEPVNHEDGESLIARQCQDPEGEGSLRYNIQNILNHLGILKRMNDCDGEDLTRGRMLSDRNLSTLSIATDRRGWEGERRGRPVDTSQEQERKTLTLIESFE